MQINDNFQVNMPHASAQQNADFISILSLEYTHVEDVDRAVKRYLGSKTRLQNKVIARDELDKLKNIGTNDVVNTARKLKVKVKNDPLRIEKNIAQFLMKTKLKDADMEVDKAKKSVAIEKKIQMQ